MFPKKIPLGLILIVPFVVQISAAVGLTGYLSLRNGRNAVNNVASQLRQEITTLIRHQLEEYLTTPHLVNQINGDAVRLGLISLDNISSLERYFWVQMQQFKTISYISLGTEKAEYVGVERLDNGTFNLEVSDRRTGYNFQTWQLDNQGHRVKLLKSKPNYDPRQRQWYQTGVKANGRSVWTDIYSYFSTKKLTITADRALYDNNQKLLGVTAADLVLTQIGDFLHSIPIGKTGQTFIIESSGYLVATSSIEDTPFSTKKDSQERLKALDSKNIFIRETSRYLQSKFGEFEQIKQPQQLEFTIKGERQFLEVFPFQDASGLNWLVVVVLPESDFMAEIKANTQTTILLCFGALILSIASGFLTTHLILRPIRRLEEGTAALTLGQLDRHIIPSKINELGKLGQSFNKMAKQLRESFDVLAKTNEELEVRVEERTAALRFSEEKFASAFRSCPNPILLSTFDNGRFMEVNESFLTFMGLEMEEVIGKTSLELQMWVEPRDRSEMLNLLAEFGSIRSQQYNIRIRSGEIRIVLVSSEIITIGGKNCIVSVLNDITHLKQTEAALELSEAKFRTIFETAQAGIYRTRRRDGLILDANQKFAELLGYETVDRIIEKSTLEFYAHPEDRQTLLKELEGQGRVDNYEIQICRQDGSLAWGLFSMRLNLEEDCIEAVVTDISERKHLEAELQKSQQFLDSIIENVPLAVFVKDVNNSFRSVLWNKTCESMFGIPKERAIGHNVYDFCPQEQADFFHSKDLEAVNRGALVQIEEEPLDTPHRDTVWLRTAKIPLEDKQGKINYLLCISENITERKKAQAELENSLALLNTTFESITDGILAVDAQGNVTHYNQKFLDIWQVTPAIFGIAPRERLPLQAQKLKNPQGFIDSIVKLSRNLEIEAYDRLEFLDGRIVERYSHPQRVGETIIGRVWSFRDITDRVRAEEALRESEERFRSIVENANDIIYLINEVGEIVYMSPNVKGVLGFEASYYLNQVFTPFIHPDDIPICFEAMSGVLATGKKRAGVEYRVRDYQGMYRWYTANISLLKDATGANLVVGIARDVTEKKQAEIALRIEKEKSERLLLNILPGVIAEKLKEQSQSLAQHFDEATILFADIVGFTPLAARLTPIELVDMLNQIFSAFDQLTETYNLEKIKTIGDAYMVVGGLPIPRSDHAEAIAEMALDMQKMISNFQIGDYPFQMRVGINTGAVVAGVIGKKKFIYDLWGDAVNIASRMESQGSPGKIQVTAETYTRLQDKYIFSKRGVIDVKGRGEILTYWLESRAS